MILTEDQIALRDVARRFAREKLRPDYQKRESEPGIDRALFREMGSLGLIGVDLPQEYGGLGESGVTAGVIIEEIAYADFNVSYLQLLGSLMGAIIHANASPELARTWNSRLVAGEAIVALGLTEPRGGSHPADMRTRAVRDGDDYLITGVKHFISNAAEARFMVVFAKTDAQAAARGVSAFIVPRELPGIQVSSPEKLMGIRGGHAFEVSLDGVRVPAANRLGAEGTGFKTAMKVLDNSRLDVAATSLGIAEAALKAAADWANQRLVGGEPIAGKQGIQFKLADMKLRLEAAWGLTMQALALRQQGQPFTQQSAMAKLFASEMVGFVTDEALQIHGGYGYTREMPLERCVRDARILRIYEGSSEIQRTIIARAVLST